MNKYRIYALIHGQVLHESVFSEDQMMDYHKTYVSSLRYVDPIKIKSEYVIICDFEERRPDAALGGAIKTIERIVRFLFLANLEDVKLTHGKNMGSLEPYIYQVNKIYSLDDVGVESEVEFKLESGNMYLPDRPEKEDWRNSKTDQLLEEIYNFHDETLERSLKYLYRSSIGHFLLDSHEKIALDHFKSIEIIVNSLSKKREFKQRLIEVADLIELPKDEDILHLFSIILLQALFLSTTDILKEFLLSRLISLLVEMEVLRKVIFLKYMNYLSGDQLIAIVWFITLAKKIKYL